MQASHVHSQPCHFARLLHLPRGPALSSEKDRFVFNKALSADMVLDLARQQFPRMLLVVDTVGHEVLLTRLEDQSLDPGKLQQEASLLLRHRLVLAQPCLKRGHRLRPPVQLVGSGMEAINLVIAKTFQGRPTEVVEPGHISTFKLADTVGHFWESQDFKDLPAALRVVLDETFIEEEREIAYVLKHQFPSGAKLSAAGARQLGVSSDHAEAW